MALNSIFDLSTTPGSNTDFSGTSVLGTGLVSTADDSFRNLAAFLAQYRNDTSGAATTAGTDTVTVTLASTITSITTGFMCLVKFGGTNTGAATFNPNSLGAKNVKVIDASGSSVNPSAGQMLVGNYGWFRYDGTNMILLNPAQSLSAYLPLAGGTMTGQLINTASSVGYTPIQVISTEAAAAAGPIIEDYRNSPSAAVNDILGQALHTGQNSTPAKVTYAREETVIVSPTAAAESATRDFYVKSGGADILAFSAQGTGFPLTNPINLGLAASVGSSALTVSLKGVNGSDPSASNPVFIPFRNVTAATGTPSYLAVTAATSIVISSGSTMGFTSAVAGRLWIVGFNDGGTFRLGLVNALSGTSIMAIRDGIYSSTAEGGAGGADSAQVIYTGTAVTSKAMTVLGYLEATEATAGTWATAPSLIQIRTPATPLPATPINTVSLETGAVASGSTTIPIDDTIPQSTEGVLFMTAPAITATSAVNVRRSEVVINVGHSVNTALLIAALFKDSDTDSLAVSLTINNGTGGNGSAMAFTQQAVFGSTSAQTMKVRAGSPSAGTTTFNGTSGSRMFGGVFLSSLRVLEIMA